MNRRRALYVFLGILGVIGVVFGLIIWDAHRRATELAREHDIDVKARIAAIRARVHPPRAALFGEPLPGNGASALIAALRGIHKIPESESQIVPAIAADFTDEGDVDDDLIEFFYAANRTRIDDLRGALRHEKLVLDRIYEQGFQMNLPELSDAIASARFLAGLSDHLYRWGQDKECLEPVLLALAVGQAVGRDGPMVSGLVQIVCESVGEEAWRGVLEEYDLDAGVLSRAARAMDQLRTTRSDMADSYEVEDAIGRRGIVDLVLAPAAGMSIESSEGMVDRHWRYLFSRSIFFAAALPVFQQYYAEMIRLRTRPSYEWESAAVRIQDAGLASRHAMARMLLPAITRAYRREATSLMSWTLMRVATAIAWYEAEKGMPPASLRDLVPRYIASLPVCPLTGKPLGYAPGKVWSYGVDGVDDGGKPNPKGDEEPGGDVVWVVKRARK